MQLLCWLLQRVLLQLQGARLKYQGMRQTVDGIHGDVWGCRTTMLLTDGWWLREPHLQLLPSFGRL
jgi:hypothetical protein